MPVGTIQHLCFAAPGVSTLQSSREVKDASEFTNRLSCSAAYASLSGHSHDRHGSRGFRKRTGEGDFSERRARKSCNTKPTKVWPSYAVLSPTDPTRGNLQMPEMDFDELATSLRRDNHA